MFGRHIQVKLAKNGEPADASTLSKEDISEITTDIVKKVTAGAVTIMAARTALSTVSTVAINLSTKAPIHIHL